MGGGTAISAGTCQRPDEWAREVEWYSSAAAKQVGGLALAEVYVDRITFGVDLQFLVIVVSDSLNEPGHQGDQTAVRVVVHNQTILALPFVAETWRPGRLDRFGHDGMNVIQVQEEFAGIFRIVKIGIVDSRGVGLRPVLSKGIQERGNDKDVTSATPFRIAMTSASSTSPRQP